MPTGTKCLPESGKRQTGNLSWSVPFEETAEPSRGIGKISNLSPIPALSFLLTECAHEAVKLKIDIKFPARFYFSRSQHREISSFARDDIKGAPCALLIAFWGIFPAIPNPQEPIPRRARLQLFSLSSPGSKPPKRVSSFPTRLVL